MGHRWTISDLVYRPGPGSDMAPLQRAEHWLTALACGLLLGSGAIFYANSFLVTEVIRALVFFYLAPLWASLIEAFFLKRRLKWSRVLTVTLALAGVWVAVGLEVGIPLPIYLGDWFGLIAGILITAGAARTEIEQPEGIFPLLFMVIIFGLFATVAQYPLLADAWRNAFDPECHVKPSSVVGHLFVFCLADDGNYFLVALKNRYRGFRYPDPFRARGRRDQRGITYG